MAKYLDIDGLSRFLDKIKGLLNLKADKTDTYTKSEVDALVAEGGGSGGENIINITWQELKDLRDNGELVAGQQYRIIDYSASTTQVDTSVAGHDFDIIVTANSNKNLSESAKAIAKENIRDIIKVFSTEDDWSYLYMRKEEKDDENGYAWVYVINSENVEISENKNFVNIDDSDIIYTSVLSPKIGDIVVMGGMDVEIVEIESVDTNYFAFSNISSWELKYCLDNDIERFNWADEENGKGVVFRLKDENENDFPYDFKNILFKRYKITSFASSKNFVGKYLYYNTNGITYNGITFLSVNKDDFIWCYTFDYRESDNDIYHEDLSVFGRSTSASGEKPSGNICTNYTDNKGKYNLKNNVFMRTGAQQYNFDRNTLERCSSNTFYGHCADNILCNTSGSSFLYSTRNTIAGSTIFTSAHASDCNIQGSLNVIAGASHYITFAKRCSGNLVEGSCEYITFEEGVENCRIKSVTSGDGSLRYVTIRKGLKGTSVANRLNLTGLVSGSKYPQECGLDKSGNYVARPIMYGVSSDEVATLISGKQDKTDDSLNTAAKTIVGAINEVNLKAEANGGASSGFVIPEDTYTREIDGEIYYALSGVSGKELYLNIDYYEVVKNCCNGFAFQTESDFVEFTLSNDDRSDIYGSITMELEQNGERYLIDSIDRSFTKSAKRKFHTLYWDSEMLKFDLKKIHSTESFEQNYSTSIHISSNDDVKIINYGVYCAPLYVKYDSYSDLVLYAINQDDEKYPISIINPTKVKLHFSNHEQRALPKHENPVVTNNPIRATYYPNPVYFVKTDKINSCFDFIGFEDHNVERFESIFGSINLVPTDFRWHKTGNGATPFCSVRIHGNMLNDSVSISIEEPNTPILKKNYIYNNRLIYTGIYLRQVINADNYDVRLYRYRRNQNKYKNGRPIKYRKLNNMDRINTSVFGDYDVFKMSKTGVKSSVSTKIRISITDVGLKEKKIGGS